MRIIAYVAHVVKLPVSHLTQITCTCYIARMDKIQSVQASQLGGQTIADIIRDGEPRVVTYHGRPEALIIKLPPGEKTLVELMRQIRKVVG